MSVSGISTNRVSSLYIFQQTTQQIQDIQQELYRVEQQLATGQQFTLPSEDPSAAMRVISSQRLLEQKDQVAQNLETGQSYLTATDSALASISERLIDIRATAIGAVGSTVSDENRQLAVAEIQNAIQQLVSLGNEQFRGRYLFGGEASGDQPFDYANGSYVEYCGGQQRLTSFADVGTSFDINVTGGEVFGCISEPLGTATNLDPVVNYDTPLSDLRGGLGIELGQIAVTADGSNSVIDLTGAATVGDVASMLRAGAPDGTELIVEITATGLRIEVAGDPSPTLEIDEVGDGETAAQLGILAETPVSGPVEGGDLDPVLRETTLLADVFGIRSSSAVHFDGEDNDLIFEAGEVGDAYDGIRIVFEDDGSVEYAGSDEQASYDAASNTLRVTVKEGATRAIDVVEAVHAAYEAGDVPIDARLDPLDDQRGGSGFVEVTPPGEYHGLTGGGSGTPLDLASGLQVVNGGQTYTIDCSSAETVQDLLASFNGTDAGILAAINDSGTGITLSTRVSGADFAVGENGGTLATQLGLRSFTEDVRLEDLNFGGGVDAVEGTDFTITLADETMAPIEIDISGVETVGELLVLINAQSPGNLEARLATEGNGIELQDNTVGAGVLTVTTAGLSSAAIDLGLVAEGQTEIAAGTNPPGETDVLRGADVHPLEAEGIFTALTRLADALAENDLGEAERALDMLDTATDSLNFVRAEVGIRQQHLDVMTTRLEDEQIAIQEAMSLDFDADLVEAASEYEAQLVALQAALMASSQILQLSLLNYL